jgi:hypothetical protein
MGETWGKHGDKHGDKHGNMGKHGETWKHGGNMGTDGTFPHSKRPRVSPTFKLAIADNHRKTSRPCAVPRTGFPERDHHKINYSAVNEKPEYCVLLFERNGRGEWI